MVSRLFIVERYEPSGGELVAALAPLPVGADTRLILAVHVPADDLVLAVVEGPDEESVAATVAAAHWRVDRLCPATWAMPGNLAEMSTLEEE
jgi:hypothetical protein